VYLHLSGSLKRKLKTQRIEKKKLLPRINDFVDGNALADNSSLSTCNCEIYTCGND